MAAVRQLDSRPPGDAPRERGPDHRPGSDQRRLGRAGRAHLLECAERQFPLAGRRYLRQSVDGQLPHARRPSHVEHAHEPDAPSQRSTGRGVRAADSGKPGRIRRDAECAHAVGSVRLLHYFVPTYAEVSFILAEAAERGWVTTAGTAAALYNQAINASMAQWGVTDATAINAYLADTAIAYKGGTPGLQQIALQKWIAFYTNGVQAWAEWRRTCVPATLVPGPDAVQNTVPRRYQYSIRELSVNAANVAAAVARQGPDVFSTRMYWDNNPTVAPTYPGATCGTR